jgi:hypothetical protein
VLDVFLFVGRREYMLVTNTICKGMFGSRPRAALHLPHHCFGPRLVCVRTCGVTMAP